MQATFDPDTGLYRAGDLAVSKALTEDLLGEAYLRLAKEQGLATIFYEGVPTLLWFLQKFTAPTTICLGFFADRTARGRGWEFCGLAWVLQQETMGNGMVKAEVGYSFFRHVATPNEKVTMGLMMEEVFFETFNVDVLIGTSPVENKLGLKYAQRLGFTLCGPIKNYLSWEGALSDAYAVTLTKADWKSAQRLDKSQRLDPDVARESVAA